MVGGTVPHNYPKRTINTAQCQNRLTEYARPTVPQKNSIRSGLTTDFTPFGRIRSHVAGLAGVWVAMSMENGGVNLRPAVVKTVDWLIPSYQQGSSELVRGSVIS